MNNGFSNATKKKLINNFDKRNLYLQVIKFAINDPKPILITIEKIAPLRF